MNIPIFLSCPAPHQESQRRFVETLRERLKTDYLTPVTLGQTDYSIKAPFAAVRSLMTRCCGVLVCGLARHWVESGTTRHFPSVPGQLEKPLGPKWLTSPWCHMEAAMGYGLGLPLLLLREDRVLNEGIFALEALGLYVSCFSVEGESNTYFSTREWSEVFRQWESKVRQVSDRKGEPPRYYDP